LSIVYGGQAPLVKGLVVKENGVDEVEIFAKAVDEDKGLAAYIIAITPQGKPKPTEEQAKFYAALAFGGKDVKAYAASGRSFKNLAVTEEELKKCKAPVLFIHGGEESANTKERVAGIRKMLVRAELKVVEGANHITTLAKPEFGTAIQEFLRANRQK
jgi:pimeloyl-ACP methyl ester carboxylesterase